MSAPDQDQPTQGPEVITLGCRLNTYESEVMRVHAERAGRRNVVIVNTCAVTGEAVRQARQTIRKAARNRPDAEIVVTGCAAQIDPAMFEGMEEVTQVLGNAEKLAPDAFMTGGNGQAVERVRVGDIMAVQETAHHLIDGFAARTRAFVQIQNGCDHRCTFCIIPYGRGPSRSVPAGAVVDQIARLVETGTREVVLTGVDITAYGADLPGRPGLGLLVQRILRGVPDLERLRLSSLDTIEIEERLLETIATEPRVMPHLHLSLQAGDDMILKRMKRRHLTGEAEAFCARMRLARPDMVFGADFIAGFPTETDAMFENTLRHVEACGLTYLHVFPFSPREGTPAARMPCVPGPVIRARAAALRDLGHERLQAHLAQLSGTRASVLMETGHQGRTPCYAPVSLDLSLDLSRDPSLAPSLGADRGHDLPPGTIASMMLHHDGGPRLMGTPVAAQTSPVELDPSRAEEIRAHG